MRPLGVTGLLLTVFFIFVCVCSVGVSAFVLIVMVHRLLHVLFSLDELYTIQCCVHFNGAVQHTTLEIMLHNKIE